MTSTVPGFLTIETYSLFELNSTCEVNEYGEKESEILRFVCASPEYGDSVNTTKMMA